MNRVPSDSSVAFSVVVLQPAGTCTSGKVVRRKPNSTKNAMGKSTSHIVATGCRRFSNQFFHNRDLSIDIVRRKLATARSGIFLHRTLRPPWRLRRSLRLVNGPSPRCTADNLQETKTTSTVYHVKMSFWIVRECISSMGQTSFKLSIIYELKVVVRLPRARHFERYF